MLAKAEAYRKIGKEDILKEFRENKLKADADSKAWQKKWHL
jgi:hypothetical protein